MDNSTNNEWIMLYLDDELPGADKEAFERRLSSEPALADELQRLRVARDAVHLWGIKETVSSIHGMMMNELAAEKKKAPEQTPVRRIIRYSLAAAAVIMLVFAGVKGYRYLHLTNERVFNEQYSSFELSTARGTGPVISTIENAYRNKNFNEVISIARKLDSLSAKDNFLTGMSYMETKQFAKAIGLFKKVANGDSNSIFKDAAEYYTALAYVEVKDYDSALLLMLAIKGNAGHLYHNKITDHLISEVKMLK